MDRVERQEDTITPEYYIAQSHFSNPGKYIDLYKDLPTSIGDLSKIIHGLLIHPDEAKKLYGLMIPQEREREPEEHKIEKILERILSLDQASLSQTRSPEKRYSTLCRGFALLMTSILRYQGVPSRVRCGFAGYFHQNFYTDHWIAEYWDIKQGRWVKVDPEIGEEEREAYKLEINHLDISADDFLVAGKVWQSCREGKIDPRRVGLSGDLKVRSWWFIRANLLRDLACLNKVELVCWDYTPFADKVFSQLFGLSEDEIKLFDDLAFLTATEGNHYLPEILKRYQNDERLQVGNTVTSYPKGPIVINPWI